MKDDVQLIIEVSERIDLLEKELKEAKKERSELESRIAEQWGAIGKQSENRNGLTIYRSRDFFCSTKAGEGDALRNALHDAGMEEMVREQVSMPSLKSMMREVAEHDEKGELTFPGVSEKVLQCVNVYESFGIRIRKS